MARDDGGRSRRRRSSPLADAPQSAPRAVRRLALRLRIRCLAALARAPPLAAGGGRSCYALLAVLLHLLAARLRTATLRCARGVVSPTRYLRMFERTQWSFCKFC